MAERPPGAAPCPAPCGPIAMVTGRYPGLSLTFIDREVQALRAMGCPVVTVTVRSPPPGSFAGPFQTAEAGRVHRLLASARHPATVVRALWAAVRHPARLAAMLRLAWVARPGGGPGGGPGAWLRHAAHLAEAVLLADLLRRQGVVHVHNHLGDGSGTVTMLAAELAGLPFSLTLHGPEVFETPARWRLDVKIARARATVCISADGRAKARRLSDPAHHHKLTVIPCGVLPDTCGTASRGPGTRLAFVGRLVPRKGAAVLIAALAQVQARGVPVALDLVGDGPERRALHALAARHGLGAQVRFHGACDQARVAAVLRQATLLVAPSLSEGLPVVLIEAMAHGLPVVASAVDGIPELVQDGRTGLLVPPGDPARLADAILTLIRDPARARRMAATGQRLVARRHDARRNAAALRDLLLGAGPGTVPGPIDTPVTTIPRKEGHHARHAP